MNALKHIRVYVLVGSLVVIVQPFPGLAQNSDASSNNLQHTPTERDGQHDFDFWSVTSPLVR